VSGATGIRAATLADLDAIEALENRAFTHDRLSRRSLRRLLAGRTCRLFVAPAEGAVAGYALVLFRAGAAAARLYSIAVDPQSAGRGLGRQLVAACEAEAADRGCAALRLEVRADNLGAIRLYEACGYRIFGRHEVYYADGSAAVRFERQLRAAAAPEAAGGQAILRP
jgi:[ribosomal protein S18]-alanine N-acetyltransferase